MTTSQDEDKKQTTDKHKEGSSSAVGWSGMMEERYKKIKENAETYPYVWGSYIVVYGGFFLWTAYRWRKLRKTEDRVRALHEKLRKLVEAEESASSTAVTNKSRPSANTAVTDNSRPFANTAVTDNSPPSSNKPTE